MTTPEQQALQLVAQAWREPATSGLEMDVTLATVIAEKFAPIIAENAALKAELQALRGSAEPYCYVYEWDTEFGLVRRTRPANVEGRTFDRFVPLYTRPAVPLTDEDIDDCIDTSQRDFNLRRQGFSGQQLTPYDDWRYWFARAIEAHIKGAKP